MNQFSFPGTGLSAQDERAISSVLLAYATGIDQRDWRLFQNCFTPDCDADYGDFGKWHGAAAITAYMKQAHAQLGPTLHRMSNIDIRAREDSVQVRCYVDAVLTALPPGDTTHRAIGLYEDKFVRTGKGWQIARRTFHPVLLE